VATLNAGQMQFYEDNGYLSPIRVFSEETSEQFRRCFDDYTKENQERLKALLPRERRQIYSQTHLFLPWVYEIVANSNLLDTVEGVIGSNILVWDSSWFVKFPHDRSFVSWHQDGAYWGLHPPKVTTAWVALAPSNAENGCLQVMAGTHKTALPQVDTYAEDNALSRGQEIAIDVDETKAVKLVLRPGEMSLHHIGVAHGSKANNSTFPRIGIAIRYIAAEVVQDGTERQIALLVRGKDEHGHFEIVDPPREGANNEAIRAEADRRVLKNTLAGSKRPQ
jgi:non-heme Fe2+,alpha-ketoglutarate-dependent halogenase